MKKFLCYDTNDAASGKINVDNRGMLKPNSTVPSGSTPYQQLVTDGDGNTKWEDRLAYETESVLKEILPEQSFTGTGQILTGGSKPIVGQTYTVKFDNTEYECICINLDDVPAIGNAEITGMGSNTGEPFLLGYVSGAFTAFVIDETNTHTVSVRGFGTQIVKIPAKFIDKNSSGYTIIHNGSTMTQQEAENYQYEILRHEAVFIIWDKLCISDIGYDGANGKMYLITQNGVRFSIAKNDDGLFDLSDRKISNASFPKDRSEGDHTASIYVSGNKISLIPGAIHTGVGSTDTLFSVDSNGTKSKDFNVLGNGEAVAPALILYSSTEDSKKRFRITVDDTGTISATEVT